jgi:hypothetical protein
MLARLITTLGDQFTLLPDDERAVVRDENHSGQEEQYRQRQNKDIEERPRLTTQAAFL